MKKPLPVPERRRSLTPGGCSSMADGLMAPAPGVGGTGAPETAAPCADAIPAWAAINTDKNLRRPRNDISCVFEKDDLPPVILQAARRILSLALQATHHRPELFIALELPLAAHGVPPV